MMIIIHMTKGKSTTCNLITGSRAFDEEEGFSSGTAEDAGSLLSEKAEHKYLYIHICIYIDAYTYVYIYTYVYTHMYSHIYIYTNLCISHTYTCGLLYSAVPPLCMGSRRAATGLTMARVRKLRRISEPNLLLVCVDHCYVYYYVY